jgi:Domain of unknown function (DUF4349)
MKLTDEQIGIELRALRETPSERFAAELDAWAAEGFPSAGRPSHADEARIVPRPRLSHLRERFSGLQRRPLRAALAGAAAIVLALTVAIGVFQTATDDPAGPQSLTGEGEPGAEPIPGGGEAAKPLGTQSAPSDAFETPSAPSDAIEPAPTTLPPVPPIPSEKLKPGQPRVQERSASMTLSTEPDQVDDVADGVVDVTDRYEGIVVSSEVSTSGEQGRASFDLRIPTANLQAALADLSDLAHVSSRDEGTLDITAPFLTAAERFDDAKAEVDALLDQLAAADSPSEVASIREQLRLARQELAAARTDLGALKQRSDFSRVSVAVVAAGDGDGWSIGDAADDAVDVLEALGGAGLVTLAVLVPLGGIAALAWLALRELRRRRPAARPCITPRRARSRSSAPRIPGRTSRRGCRRRPFPAGRRHRDHPRRGRR